MRTKNYLDSFYHFFSFASLGKKRRSLPFHFLSHPLKFHTLNENSQVITVNCNLSYLPALTVVCSKLFVLHNNRKADVQCVCDKQ